VLIEVVVVIVLGAIPPVLSLFMVRKAKQRWQTQMARLRRREFNRLNQSRLIQPFNYENYQSNPVSWIGDKSCSNNALSPYLRCAINPSGPCEGCIYYKKDI